MKGGAKFVAKVGYVSKVTTQRGSPFSYQIITRAMPVPFIQTGSVLAP